jgi:spore maturation protein CgeB
MVISPQYCPTPVIDMLRKAGKKTIAYFTECPYEDGMAAPEMAPHFDYVCVNDRNSVNLFRSYAPNVLYVPHSYDPEIHYPAESGTEGDGIVFVGTMYRDRVRFLKQVNWESIPLELYGLRMGVRKNSRMASYFRGELTDNEDTAAIYRRAAGGFGIHRKGRFGFANWEIDEGEAYSAGPRVYELAACGTFQVSDYRQEIEDIFGDAVPFYRTPKELEATLHRAVDDPVWRSEMAERQREAVQGRDCKATMATVLEAVA